MPARIGRGATFAIVVVIAAAGIGLLFVFDRWGNRQAGVDTGAAIVEAGQVFDGGTDVNPPRELPDFTLTSHNGEPISLSDLRGKVVLLYFGYTHCPDYCPTTLGDFQQIKSALGGDAENVAFVLVSVDGSRDTPEVMNTFLTPFDPTFIGMTGPEEDVAKIGEEYGLHMEHEAETSADDYLVNHGVSVYMIDAEGRLRTVYMYGTEPDVITEDVRALL